MRFKEIDIKKADELTFGQYIDLKNILSKIDDSTKDSDLIKDIVRVLYKKDTTIKDYMDKKLIKYIGKVIEGITYWADLENKELAYKPSEEEKRAGIIELNDKVGYLGTVKVLAKNYSLDPDLILSWSWSKVFGILKTDLEEFRYQERLNKIMQEKYK